MGNKLVKNSLIYAIGDIAPRLLSFISFPILTTYLTPAEYGIINYVNTLNLFLTIVGFLCLNTYYLVYYYRMEDEIAQKKLLGNLSVFVVTVNIVLSIIFFVFGPKLFHDLGNVKFYPYIAIGIITNFFNILAILPSALYRVLEHPLPLTILNIIKGVLSFGVTLLLVVGFHFKAEGVLAANMFVSIAFGILFGYITIKNMIWNINWGQIKKALGFSLPLVPGALSYQLSTMSDRILIDKYLNLTDLGIYGTASTLALILNIIAYGAYKAFEPHFFKVYGTDCFQKEFTKVRDGYFFIIVIGAFAIALFSKEFFQIFANEAYHRSYFYVPFILIGLVASSVSMLYGTIITAKGKNKISSAISIIGGLVSVGLNILLLRKYGIIAACFTSAVVFIGSLIARIYFSKVKDNRFKIFEVFIFISVIVGVFVYAINYKDIFYAIFFKSVVFVFTVCVAFKLMGYKIKDFKRMTSR